MAETALQPFLASQKAWQIDVHFPRKTELQQWHEIRRKRLEHDLHPTLPGDTKTCMPHIFAHSSACMMVQWREEGRQNVGKKVGRFIGQRFQYILWGFLLHSCISFAESALYTVYFLFRKEKGPWESNKKRFSSSVFCYFLRVEICSQIRNIFLNFWRVSVNYAKYYVLNMCWRLLFSKIHC